MLKKVISGGQSGADLAGIFTAKTFGFETGGTMPFGFKTLDGCRPEYKKLYGCVAHASSSYPPRTRQNVYDSDGTLRLAFDFLSPGEICTLRAIKSLKKEKFDVDLSDPCDPEAVILWMNEHNIETLNVAGNSEQTCPGTFDASCLFLAALFEKIKPRQS